MALLLCGWLRTCVYVWWMKDSMLIQHCTSNHAKLWAKLDDLGILNLVCQQVGTSGNLRPWREKMHDLGVVRTSCQACRSCMVMRDLCFVCGKSFVIIFKHRQELRAPSVSWYFSAFGKSYVIVFKQNMRELRTPCVNWEGPCLILVMSGNVWSIFLVFGKSYVIILARSEIVHTSSPRVNW